MNRQERCAKAGHRAGPLLDGVADVVELEVEEDLLARSDQFAGEFEAARIGELVTDLVEDPDAPMRDTTERASSTEGRSSPMMSLSRGSAAV